MAAAPVGCAEGAPCVEQRGRLAVVKSGGTADEVGGSGWRVDDDDSGWGGWMARGGSPIRWRSSRPRWPRMAHPPAAPFARWTTADARHRQRRTDLPARRAAPGVVTIGGGNNGGGMVHGGGWGGGMAHSRRGGRRTAVLGRGWTESMGRPWPGWRRRHHHHCPSPSFLHAASLSPLALTGGGGVAPMCGRIRRRRKPCCQRMGWGENKGGRERRRQCTRCSRPAPPAGAGGEGRERQ